MAPLRGLTHLEQEQDCKGSRRENSCWHGSGHPLQTPAGPVPAVQVHARPHHICSHTVEDGFPSITFWILGREARVDMFLTWAEHYPLPIPCMQGLPLAFMSAHLLMEPGDSPGHDSQSLRLGCLKIGGSGGENEGGMACTGIFIPLCL